MKAMKKTLSLILSILLIISGLVYQVSAMTIFEDCFGFEIDTYNHTAELVEYTGEDTAISVPKMFRSFPVTSIARSAFCGNENIESINLPDSVTEIKNEAFAYCTSLKSITVPSNVNVVGTGFCTDCTALESVEYYSSAPVPNSAFAGCTSLSDVTLSDKCSSLRSGAFARCSSLTDIDFAENITSIGDSVFFKCGLTETEIPSGITSLPYYSFAYIESLEKMVIPESVTEINPMAFVGSDNLVIYCYADSCAHHFAEDNEIDYVLIDDTLPTEPETQEPTQPDGSYILGDADGSGFVDIVDATFVQRFATGLSVPVDEATLMHGNVDGSEELDAVDATFIMRYIVHIRTPYSIGEIVSD